MFSDKAKAMAPRSLTNHNTPCIFPEMLFLFRQRLAIQERGKILSAHPNKQKLKAKTENKISEFRELPVKTPMPM
jgi:hypothetical protein